MIAYPVLLWLRTIEHITKVTKVASFYKAEFEFVLLVEMKFC